MRTHAISKRVLSLMLAIMLVLGMIPVFASAADTTTIYFDNTYGWSSVKAYIWDANGTAYVTWPGSNMTLVEGTIYSIDVPADYVNIIFNNGSGGTGNQTADLTIPTDGTNLYSDGAWSTYDPTGSCEHVWDEGTVVTAPTCVATGVSTYTCTLCGLAYDASVDALGHDYVDGACTVCGATESVVIYFQNTAAWATVNAYYWCDAGNLSTWPGDAMTLVAGDIYSITLSGDAQYVIFNNGDGTQTDDLTISADYDLYVYNSGWTNYNPEACAHEWGEGTVVTAPTCTEAGESSYTCSLCGESKTISVDALGHSYSAGICTVCGAEKPVLDFYLIGYINGADYGCESDYENMGEYKFVDGTLSATFTADSYVFIKTEGNANWYMAEAYCAESTCTFIEGGTEKMYVPGNQALIFTLVENDDGSLTLSYVSDPDACAHEWGEGTVVTAATCTTAGETSYTCDLCGNTKTETVAALGHNYVDGICANCGEAEPVVEYYLIGYINGANYGCEEDYENMGEYKFVDGALVATFSADSYVFIKTTGNAAWYMAEAYCTDTTCTFINGGTEKMYVPGGVELTFALVENEDGSLTLSYEAGEACAHASHSTDGICADCGMTVDHTYVDGICSICGAEEPEVVEPTYYLAGSFNEWTAADESYKLTLLGEVYYISISLTAGSYEFKITDGTWDNAWPSSNYVLEVPVDSDNISIMFYADSGEIEVSGVNQPAEEPTELVLGDNAVALGTYTFTAAEAGTLNVVVSAMSILNEETGEYETANPSMMFGRMYTLLVNGETNFMPENQVEVAAGDVVTIELSGLGNECNITLNLSYEEPVVVPTLTLNYPTLAFEDEILYNAYFTVDDASSIVEMGMITFSSKLTDGTIDDAVEVISGYTTSGSSYIVHSNGVPAKNLGDALYFKVYAKLSDGTYAYSDVGGFNAIAYAKTILNNSSSSDKAKALVVAMLNYGAAAQVQFSYNTDSLMNASLTEEQLALVDAYDESMVDAVVKADSSKVGLFVHNGGYTKVYPTVSFEGAFAINYYFATANTPDSAPTFYYWDAETYANATELTAENATGTMDMVLDGDQWYGTVAGIAAKEIDQTYYTAGVYYVGDTAYYSPVVSYSLGNYCETLAAQDNAFGAATAVYGYYAKAYFAS